MASLSSLGFECEEAECEGQVEFSFLPGCRSSQLSSWGIGGVGGVTLLASIHMCPENHVPERNKLSVNNELGFRGQKQLF